MLTWHEAAIELESLDDEIGSVRFPGKVRRVLTMSIPDIAAPVQATGNVFTGNHLRSV